MLAAVAGCLGACSSSALAESGSTPLWTTLNGPCSADPPEPQRRECQRVTLQPAALQRQADTISLALSDSLTVVARKQPSYPDAQAGTVVWRGVLDRDPYSSVAFAMIGKSVSGRIVTSDGRVYRLRSTPKDGAIVESLNAKPLPDEHPPGGLPVIVQRQPPAVEQPVRPLGTRMLDVCQIPGQTAVCVLVVYTPAAAALGEALLRSDIALAVDDVNFALANSGVSQSIILAEMKEVKDYFESDPETDMVRLVTDGDIFLDDVHTWRKQVRADLVFFVTTWSDYGAWSADQFGAADLGNNGFAKKAFAVVSRNLLVNHNYAFAHELGHLMGASHDGMTSSGFEPGPFGYSHGHIDPVPGESRVSGTSCPPWRTIMAEAAYCPGCIAQPFWSSSDEALNFCGRLLGNAQTEDNARTLNITAPTVAGFR